MDDQAVWLRNPALALPAYTYVDAGRYVGIPSQTVRNWYRGSSSHGHTMRPVVTSVGTRGLSYLQLAEVTFIAKMRSKKLPLNAIRTAYDHVRAQLGADYPFAQQRFLTDGADLFIEALGSHDVVVNVSKRGQHAWREAIASYAGDFDYIDQLALRWHPRGRERLVVIDPQVSFGRPTIDGRGIPTMALASLSAAGEDVDSIARDFGLTREQVKDALWFEDPLHNAA